jgi:hypothetical protein
MENRTVFPENLRSPQILKKFFVPTLNQTDPVHDLPNHFSRIHFNIIFHVLLTLPSGLPPSGFPTKTLYLKFKIKIKHFKYRLFLRNQVNRKGLREDFYGWELVE